MLQELRSQTGRSVGCQHRFPGQYEDSESGLHYDRYRYYDGETGQYLSPDPWGVSCTRVRHYTNRKGSNAIKESGVIKAKDNGRVYVELANKKPLSPKDAENKYQIGRGKGRDYIETDVPTESLELKVNPRYHTKELTIKGDIVLEKPNIVQRN